MFCCDYLLHSSGQLLGVEPALNITLYCETEDEEATAFIQEVYGRVTPTIVKILSGDDDIKLHLEILEANKAIENWQNSHSDKADMVDSIDIKRIEDIIVKAHFQVAKFEVQERKEQFFSRMQELVELVEESS